MFSGEKNPYQWANEETTRACSKYGQGNNTYYFSDLLNLRTIVFPNTQNVFVSSCQQTNTADMLDLAVDYIKDLQNQFKVITEEPKLATSTFLPYNF